LCLPLYVPLDGEVVVLTAAGRADFELLAARIHGRAYNDRKGLRLAADTSFMDL
jgi:ATP-dependent DNA ligase